MFENEDSDQETTNYEKASAKYREKLGQLSKGDRDFIVVKEGLLPKDTARTNVPDDSPTSFGFPSQRDSAFTKASESHSSHWTEKIPSCFNMFNCKCTKSHAQNEA